MSDLFEPLRDKLRQRGWQEVQRWQARMWRNPEGEEYDEAEAFRQLERLEAEDTPDD
jgi:hypothetical protein